MNFSLHTRSLGPFGTNCVVLANADSKEILVFDVPVNVASFLKEFAGFALTALLMTHGHFDHTLGIAQVSPRQIYAHQDDKKLFTRPQVMSAWMDPAEVEALQPVPVTHWLSGPQKLHLAGLDIEVRHAPGHSPGSVVYYLPSLKAAVVGDCIFQGSVGRTDLPGGSMNELMQSLQTQVMTLPDATKLYCGHGPVTTVADERENNPFLQGVKTS